MAWFKELFKREPGQLGEAYPMLQIPEKETVEVTFLEDHPRVVDTKYGERAVINVMHNDEPKSLWLSRLGLANEIANLEKQVDSLKGKKAKITNLGKTGRMFRYQAVWISKAEKAKEIKEKTGE
jgi:hypothetical protein